MIIIIMLSWDPRKYNYATPYQKIIKHFMNSQDILSESHQGYRGWRYNMNDCNNNNVHWYIVVDPLRVARHI